MNLYHFITIKDYREDYYNHRKLGICSPRALYDLNRDLFMKISFEIYLKRTSSYLNKSVNLVTAEDVLDFLDNSPLRRNKGFDSRTIFFSFIQFSKLNRGLQRILIPLVQLTVDSDVLKKYTPKLVMFGAVKHISWSEIEDTNFIDWVESAGNIQPTNNERVYSRLPHLALLDAYQIPFKDVISSFLIE